jgi:hypothetical protein
MNTTLFVADDFEEEDQEDNGYTIDPDEYDN